MKAISYLKKIRKKYISESDLKDLLHLMDAGFSFVEAMEIAKDTNNMLIYNQIQTHLEKGEDTMQFMQNYLSSNVAFYFTCFGQFLPFYTSLHMAYTITHQQKQAKETFIKSLIYPFTLLFSTITGVFVFDRTILPNMLSIMKSFHSDTSRQLLTTKLFEFASITFSVIVILTLLITFLLIQPSNIVSTYKFFSLRLPDSFIVQYASLEFARIFAACASIKLSTRQILIVMKSLHTKPILPFLASEVEKSLQQGTTMNKAITSVYIEQKLVKFFRLAMKEGDTKVLLDAYIKLCEEREAKRIKHLTTYIQLVAYGWIGMMLVVVYQVLMMPLQMLQNIY